MFYLTCNHWRCYMRNKTLKLFENNFISHVTMVLLCRWSRTTSWWRSSVYSSLSTFSSWLCGSWLIRRSSWSITRRSKFLSVFRLFWLNSYAIHTADTDKTSAKQTMIHSTWFFHVLYSTRICYMHYIGMGCNLLMSYNAVRLRWQRTATVSYTHLTLPTKRIV